VRTFLAQQTEACENWLPAPVPCPDHATACSSERIRQFCGDEAQVKAWFVSVSRNSTESFGKGRPVAVLTAWADFPTTPYRIPLLVFVLIFRLFQAN
jgi:hypothetical protein